MLFIKFFYTFFLFLYTHFNAINKTLGILENSVLYIIYYTVPAMKTQQNIGEFFTANLQGFERK